MTECVNDFDTYSKRIVKEFIQNVVVLDDMTYGHNELSITQEEVQAVNQSPISILTNSQRGQTYTTNMPTGTSHSNNAINTQNIVRAFREQDILCTCIDPEIKTDGFDSDEERSQKANDLFRIISKADIVILDWQTFNDDTKGELTCELLKKFKDESDKLRLIIIYTGTNVKTNVFPELKKIFNPQDTFFDENNCNIKHKALSIKIVLKNEATAHKEGLNINKCDENEIPQLCIDELSNITKGLISNAALCAITDIRYNTYKILSSFSGEYDAPYINHKIKIKCPNESDDFLLKIIFDKITSTINTDQVRTCLNDEIIGFWLDYNNFDKTISLRDGSITYECDYKKLITKGLDEYQKTHQPPKAFNKLESFTPYFIKSPSTADIIDTKFTSMSITTNRFYSAQNKPQLTLGSIINKANSKEYFLCLQPRCDSVRIDEKTKFLFMPLKKTENNEKPKLCIYDKNNDKCFMLTYSKACEIQSKYFNKDNVINGHIEAKYENEEYIFTEQDGSQYRWITELNFSYAQKIVQEFANNICRVGFDEYEWFRTQQKN